MGWCYTKVWNKVSKVSSFIFLFKKYLFIWLCYVLVAANGIFRH